MKTYVVNLISGPGAGKSVAASLLFADLKIAGYICEYVTEYAKTLIWRGDFDTLDNQHYVSTKQYNMFKAMVGQVQYIITDGSLIHGLYYNRTNATNKSDKDVTERDILKYFNEFNNINVFLERGEFEYEQAGRQQSEAKAKEIDVALKAVLTKHNIPFTSIKIQGNQIQKLSEIVCCQHPHPHEARPDFVSCANDETKGQ